MTQVNTWINGLTGCRIAGRSSARGPPPDDLWIVADRDRQPQWSAPSSRFVYSRVSGVASISHGKPLRVAVQTKTVYSRLWSLHLDSGDAEPVVQTTYTRIAENPSFSRDGRQTAFVSNETRGYNIWVADGDFRQRRQLTFLDSMEAETPRWSRGKEIAFMAFVGGLKSIYIVEVAFCRGAGA
jgi:Tol biopolymer transport system component